MGANNSSISIEKPIKFQNFDIIYDANKKRCVFSNRPIQRGDIIFIEECYSFVIDKFVKLKVCKFCGSNINFQGL